MSRRNLKNVTNCFNVKLRNYAISQNLWPTKSIAFLKYSVEIKASGLLSSVGIWLPYHWLGLVRHYSLPLNYHATLKICHPICSVLTIPFPGMPLYFHAIQIHRHFSATPLNFKYMVLPCDSIATRSITIKLYSCCHSNRGSCAKFCSVFESWELWATMELEVKTVRHGFESWHCSKLDCTSNWASFPGLALCIAITCTGVNGPEKFLRIYYDSKGILLPRLQSRHCIQTFIGLCMFAQGYLFIFRSTQIWAGI